LSVFFLISFVFGFILDRINKIFKLCTTLRSLLSILLILSEL